MDEITSLEDIESIDELVDRIDSLNVSSNEKKSSINPEDEFWGHCSSLQIWAENDYNTNLLHGSLAFPLLAKLSSMGDPLAKKVFKKEVIRRLSSRYFPTVFRLIEAGYTFYFEYEVYEITFEEMQKKLNKEELKEIIEAEAGWSAGGGYLGNYEELEVKYSLNSEELEIFKEIESHIGRFIPSCNDTSIKGPFIYIENNKVILLALDNLNLTYIPECVGSLKNIERLRLGDNKLKQIPESIGNLKNLLNLSLHSNLLDSLPQSIKNLKKLDILLLSDNEFTEIPIDILFLENLEYLTLRKNKLSQIPKEITKLKNLERLELRYNNLTNIPKFISNLTSLKELYLYGNPLKEIPESVLHLVKSK